MKTVYSIASARTIKHLTGVRAGKVSHTAEIKKVWNKEKRAYVVGFDTIEDQYAKIEEKETYKRLENRW